MSEDQEPLAAREQLRRAIYHVELYYRYYYLVANSMTWKSRRLQMVIAGTASIPAILLAIGVPREFAMPTFTLLTLAMAWSAHSNYAAHSVMAMRISEDYLDMCDRYRHLWLQPDNSLLNELIDLRKQERSIARGHTLLGTNDKLLNRANKEARESLGYELSPKTPTRE